MNAVSIIDQDGTLVVSSETIAAGSGVQHKNVLELIHSNRFDFEEFGGVAFETRPFATAGGVQSRQVALLNEQQATLLMTYQRNTEQVRQFKKALVRAFYDQARRATVPAVPESDAVLVARALQASARMLEAKDAEIAVLTPKAGAWDELASGAGDYDVADAAKILARAGIETGRQRLFDQLASIGWVYRSTASGKWKAYQSAVDAGYLAEKPTSHHHPRTGELVIDPPQVRVTVKGLERLRVRLGRFDQGAPALALVGSAS
ncbi:phage regulatory protein/antirepressor Ant [Curtobacterium sp. MCLR17_036]|uniref:phage regulatory protein/antirepressor Ant n=1 Tax=Curtobacterium sp. MCLR17_036 TaxID=2175620 RepID=UPI000DA77E80|nr:phage regulatory protein/antirepressor Ant [Curtobacterium sp. MCLR17_036]WIE65915.1 phage regulatory protein/antirepressor Ant [Curtobacterium sp. MCLR17_036]